MNILFLTNYVTPYQLDFLEEFNNKDNVKIFGYFLFSKDLNKSWNLELPAYVHVANFNKKLIDYYKLYKYLRNNKIEKIIISGYTLPTTFFLIGISKILKIDLFFWLERPINQQVGFKKYLKEFYLKVTLGGAKKIFAIGKLASEIYKKYNASVVNIPYCMNLDKFYNIKRGLINEKKINFLFSGQYIDRKNIINTIIAFKKIENNNITLNLIGEGELKEEVIQLIKDDNRINDLGFVQPQMLADIFSCNDIFIMPSIHDGWALVINEAMASSMPIISTDKVGAVVEYINHKENGYICSTNVESINEGIMFYIDNIHLIKTHSEINRDIIKNSLGDVKNAVLIFQKNLLT